MVFKLLAYVPNYRYYQFQLRLVSVCKLTIDCFSPMKTFKVNSYITQFYNLLRTLTSKNELSEPGELCFNLWWVQIEYEISDKRANTTLIDHNILFLQTMKIFLLLSFLFFIFFYENHLLTCGFIKTHANKVKI